MTSPTARASIIWLVGDFAGYEPADDIAADVLRILVRNYANESDEVKAQKTKLEVELETVVRTNESKVKVLQNSRDKALADSSQLRQDLQASESKRAQAEADRERVQQSILPRSSVSSRAETVVGELSLEKLEV